MIPINSHPISLRRNIFDSEVDCGGVSAENHLEPRTPLKKTHNNRTVPLHPSSRSATGTATASADFDGLLTQLVPKTQFLFQDMFRRNQWRTIWNSLGKNENLRQVSHTSRFMNKLTHMNPNLKNPLRNNPVTQMKRNSKITRKMEFWGGCFCFVPNYLQVLSYFSGF